MKPAPTRTRSTSNRVRSSGMHTKQVFDVHWGRRGGRKFGVPAVWTRYPGVYQSGNRPRVTEGNNIGSDTRPGTP